MDFAITEHQKMIKTMARDLLSNECPITLVRRIIDDEPVQDPEPWQKMADAGWFGLAFPEEYGGTGGTFLDLIVLTEEMGRALVPGPFFSTVVLGGLTILKAGNEQQKKQFLPGIAAGDLILTLAHTEKGSEPGMPGTGTEAVLRNGKFVISGTKVFVPDAHIARWLLTNARISDSGQEGTTLFLINTDSKGIKCTLHRTLCGDKQGEVILDRVEVPEDMVLGGLAQGELIISEILNLATIAKCAEMLGAAQRVLEITVEYAKQRRQFGRVIGSFQVIQHHCANMATDIDGMRLITYEAAWLASAGLPCAKEAAMAQIWCSQAFKRVALLGLKIHGGTGFMREHDMSLYFRKASASPFFFGSAEFYREMLLTSLSY